MMTFRDWLRRFWSLPDVGQTYEAHVQDVQLRAWSHEKLREFNERLTVLEVKVEALAREHGGNGRDD